MISNKLDADRGCNGNLYGDRGTHVNGHIHAHSYTATYTIVQIYKVHAGTWALLMKESVIIAYPRHTYIHKYIHPTLQRVRSSKSFEKREYLLLCIIRIIDMSPPSLGCVQLKWKWRVICMITDCTVHTCMHTYTLAAPSHEYVMKSTLKLERWSFISFYPLLPHLSHFQSSSPISSPTSPLLLRGLQLLNI